MIRKFRALLPVTGFWCVYVAILFLTSPVKSFLPPGKGTAGPLAWGAVSAALLLPLTLALVRREGRPAESAGVDPRKGGPARLAVGTLIGLAVYGVNLPLISLWAGPVSLTLNPHASLASTALAVGTLLALSCMEELGFRGWTLRRLHERISLWPAQLLTAAAFGASHLLFGWTWGAVLSGVIPCGLLFGMAAFASRGLAMPVGLHAGLNLAAWAIGEKGQGIWVMTADRETSALLAAWAPVSGAVVVLLTAFLLFLWGRGKMPACKRPPF